MLLLTEKQVLVAGLNTRGLAACRLLAELGARVTAWSPEPASAQTRTELTGIAIEVAEGDNIPNPAQFELAVLDPGVRPEVPAIQALRSADVPLISELELGFQQVHCLCLAVAGTNGKSTTAELLARLLEANHRTTLIAGHAERPLCSVIQESKSLDYLILNVSPRQLEFTELFRPVVAVLLNAGARDPECPGSADELLSLYARLFRQQQLFDWVIVQAETLSRLRRLNLAPRSKVITFSGRDEAAELHLDRGLILSSLPKWPGPLLDLDHCQFAARHSAENIMAAFAVGHVLRLPLETMRDATTSFTPGPHRFQLVAEIDGVKFVNDAKATNVEALQTALSAVQGKGGGQNVWLIAGGTDDGAGFHDLGPLVSRRVRRAFLLGKAAEKIRSAWSLFTPCTIAQTLLEAVNEAAKNAAFGDVVLFSPACLSFGQFRDYQQSGEEFCRAVESIHRGAVQPHPNIHGEMAV